MPQDDGAGLPGASDLKEAVTSRKDEGLLWLLRVGSRVQGLGFGVQGLGLGFRVLGLGFRAFVGFMQFLRGFGAELGALGHTAAARSEQQA